jgi:predicted nucleotidyltransferase
MPTLHELAFELGVDERTLRRAASDGLVGGETAGRRPRSIITAEERCYAIAHWPLLSALRRALRTEPNVRLAALYGSVARGDDTDASDVDLLVSLAEDRPDAAVKLAVRLERALSRKVDVARLNRIERNAPLMLLQAIQEGRVVLDRDTQWPQLVVRRNHISRRAVRAHNARRSRARASVDELVHEQR